MADGRNDTPKDAADTERLMAYWSEGEGAAKIVWDAPGAFTRCETELGKYVDPKIVKGLCSNLGLRATGMRPGSKAYDLAHGHAYHGDNGHGAHSK